MYYAKPYSITTMRKQIKTKDLTTADRMEIVHKQLQFNERYLRLAVFRKYKESTIQRIENKIDELNERFMRLVETA
jgi:hypothetical protein